MGREEREERLALYKHLWLMNTIFLPAGQTMSWFYVCLFLGGGVWGVGRGVGDGVGGEQKLTYWGKLFLLFTHRK